MPRSGNGRPGPQGASGPSSGRNTDLAMEQHVLLALANSVLDVLAFNQFNQVEAAVGMRGGTLGFTQEEYFSYQITAVKARNRYVLQGRWREFGYEPFTMEVQRGWVLSPAMLSFLAAIGIARIGDSGQLQIIPLWDVRADAAVLDRMKRDRLTRLIQEAYDLAGFKYETSISTDYDGHQQVMVITYLPQAGKWVAREPFGLEDAVASRVLGVTPIKEVVDRRGGPEYEIVDTDALAAHLRELPLWLPPLQFRNDTVINYLLDYSDLRK